jgi:glycogen debranching enzyme
VLEGYEEFVCDLDGNGFAGVPELTNKDGEKCDGSCESQAWSCAGLVELICDLNKL